MWPIDLLGVSSRGDLPALGQPRRHAGARHSSYPGFVNWITQQHWDIGIAPLADTPFQPLQVGDQGSGLCGDGPAGAGLGPRGVSRHAGRRAGRHGCCRMTRTRGSWRWRAWCAMRTATTPRDGARAAFDMGRWPRRPPSGAPPGLVWCGRGTSARERRRIGKSPRSGRPGCRWSGGLALQQGLYGPLRIVVADANRACWTGRSPARMYRPPEIPAASRPRRTPRPSIGLPNLN